MIDRAGAWSRWVKRISPALPDGFHRPLARGSVQQRDLSGRWDRVLAELGSRRARNVAKNKQVRQNAAKHGLTPREARDLSKEIHDAKASGSYDLDDDGDLLPSDIEDIANDIRRRRRT
jgi:hypothetical protein